ncbi:hypothetical protein ACQEXU_15085 [Vibrio sp. TRT 21S02]|uniref:hypothetical protein n=1 Tax=Vibrio sp. TRT 21S02 TaxID=3418507 RepID=UPI003CF7B553
MKHLKNLLLGMVLATLSSASVAAKQDGDWTLIAEKLVNYKSETDVVRPIPFLKARNFGQIKLTCTQGTVSLHKIVVTMSDGSTKELSSMGTLSKGMSTRTWILPGNEDAKLRKLEMTYDSWGSQTLNAFGVGKKAKIEVWGKKRENE